MRLLAIALLTSAFPAIAASPALLENPWAARLIAVPGASSHDCGVYHFRRTFDLSTRPAHYLIHVSGDNRYILFVKYASPLERCESK